MLPTATQSTRRSLERESLTYGRRPGIAQGNYTRYWWNDGATATSAPLGTACPNGGA